MKHLVACLIATPLLLVGPVSQAAGLALLPGGSVGGGMLASLTSSAGPLEVSGTVQDTSNAQGLSGRGSFEAAAPYGGGNAYYQWVRAADLRISGAAAQFELTGASTMQFQGVTGITELLENSGVNLQAALLVDGQGQADGTPVRLTLTAATVFDTASTLPGMAAASSFELVVVQGVDVLAHVSSADANRSFSLEFDSQVGANLTLQITHLNTPYRLGDAFDASAAGQHFWADDRFSGSLAVSAVPEPGALALLLAGLAGLAGRATLARRRA